MTAIGVPADVGEKVRVSCDGDGADDTGCTERITVLTLGAGAAARVEAREAAAEVAGIRQTPGQETDFCGRCLALRKLTRAVPF